MPTIRNVASLFSALLLVVPLTAAKPTVVTPESKLRSMMFAYEFYVQIEGTKQGKLKGESVRDVWKDKIAGLDFQYEVSSPRDLASGMASGKRQHKPIKFTKEWGASSPQLFQALITNEVLKTVTFEFLRTTADGAEEVFHTIKLTNASISNLRIYTASSAQGGAKSATDSRELEEVSLTFEKIEIENKKGKTSATDDWKK